MSDRGDKDSKRSVSRGTAETSGVSVTQESSTTDIQDSATAERAGKSKTTNQSSTTEKHESSATERVVKPKTTGQLSTTEKLESSATERVVKPKTANQSSTTEKHESSATERVVKPKTANQSSTMEIRESSTERVVKPKTFNQSSTSDKQHSGLSDVQHCSPCSREGRSVEATKFCKDCDEFLCEKCVHDHRKFVVTRDHKIMIKPTVVASPRQKAQLTDKCTNHEGKVLEFFCSDHDELCCSVCVAVAHRGCKDVTYIPEAAVGIESSLELLEVKENILKIKDQVDDLRTKREENQTVVQQQKEDIVTDILDLRIRIGEVLDKLESQQG